MILWLYDVLWFYVVIVFIFCVIIEIGSISRLLPGAYFVNIVERLVSLGYQRGVNIKGAPYDYRKAPSKFSLDYFQSNYLLFISIIIFKKV